MNRKNKNSNIEKDIESRGSNKFRLVVGLIISAGILYGAISTFFSYSTDVHKVIRAKKQIRKEYKDLEHTDQEPVYVAVVDTGFDMDHVAYYHNVSTKYIYSTDGSADIREVPSYASGQYRLTHHGTHVVGILCGQMGLRSDGSYAYQGIAPNAKIILVQLLPNASAKEMAKAFNYIEQTPAKVVSISMSFGGRRGNSGDSACQDPGMPAEIFEAILNLANSGKIIVISAGNDGVALESTLYGWSLMHLARLAKGRVIIVGASEYRDNTGIISYIFSKLFNKWSLGYYGDRMAYFSNYPATSNTSSYFITAPGVNIESSVTNTVFPIQTMSGTSMATPIVSGALVRILEQIDNRDSDNSIDRAVDLLFKTARRHNLITGEKLGPDFGSGMVDLSPCE